MATGVLGKATIPVSSPLAGYLAHKLEIDQAVHEVFESGSYILGEQVERFEEEFAAYVGCRHAIGVANGTEALELALRACGIGRGDAVLTVSNTAVATVAAIDLAGLSPGDVRVEVILGQVDSSGHLESTEVMVLPPMEQQGSVSVFGKDIIPERTGRLGYAL